MHRLYDWIVRVWQRIKSWCQRPIVHWIIRVWLQLKIWYRLFLPVRFSFLAVGFFALAFIFVPQGEDALRFLDEAAISDRLRFFACTLFFAIVTWYASRQLLHVQFPVEPAPPKHSWIISWTPRLLGAAIFTSTAYALYHAEVKHWQWIAIYIAVAILFLMATAARRVLLERRKSERTTRRDASLKEFPQISKWLIAAIAFEAIAFFLLACKYAVPIGQTLGAPGVVAVSLTGWVALGGLLAYWGGKMRFPIGTALFVFALIISPYADNHRIRDLGDAPPGPRLTVEQQFDAWAVHAKPPYFVVATQGGGIRAAYWTALVLATLDGKTQNEFSNHLFAISGVSGGSVGAAAYVAALSHPNAGKVIDDMFAADALGPLLMAMLQTDFAQRFLPLGFPDRAEALEEAWEEGWSKAAHDSTFQDSFLQIFANRSRPTPSLFMNATVVEEGRRIIVSNCHVDGFTEAADAIDAMQRDMPVSAAAHFSARFPYISPVGTIPNRDPKQPDRGTCFHCDMVCRHVGDGGYFENSGAATAAEIVTRLKKKTTAPIYGIVIDFGEAVPVRSVRYAPETLSPPIALFHTRDARGAMAIADFGAAVDAPNIAGHAVTSDHTIHFTLTQPGKGEGSAIPLGWLLSEASQRAMRAQMEKSDSTTAVVKLIGGKP